MHALAGVGCLPVIERFLIVSNVDAERIAFNKALEDYINNVWDANYFKANAATF